MSRVIPLHKKRSKVKNWKLSPYLKPMCSFEGVWKTNVAKNSGNSRRGHIVHTASTRFPQGEETRVLSGVQNMHSSIEWSSEYALQYWVEFRICSSLPSVETTASMFASGKALLSYFIMTPLFKYFKQVPKYFALKYIENDFLFKYFNKQPNNIHPIVIIRFQWAIITKLSTLSQQLRNISNT